ncbi:TPA: hypothetical protein ACH3X2_005229 [Trebouxia sp. C0005]
MHVTVVCKELKIMQQSIGLLKYFAPSMPPQSAIDPTCTQVLCLSRAEEMRIAGISKSNYILMQVSKSRRASGVSEEHTSWNASTSNSISGSHHHRLPVEIVVALLATFCTAMDTCTRCAGHRMWRIHV